jgi:hypothetical protein
MLTIGNRHRTGLILVCSPEVAGGVRQSILGWQKRTAGAAGNKYIYRKTLTRLERHVMMARPTFGFRIRTRTANRIAACCAIAASPSLPFKPPCGVGCRARARLRALGLPVVSRSPMPNAVYLIVSYLIVSSIVSSIVSEATPRGLKNLKNT